MGILSGVTLVVGGTALYLKTKKDKTNSEEESDDSDPPVRIHIWD